MARSKFSDRLMKDGASEYLLNQSSDDRRPVLAVNRLPEVGEAFNLDEQSAVSQIFEDHSRYEPR